MAVIILLVLIMFGILLYQLNKTTKELNFQTNQAKHWRQRYLEEQQALDAAGCTCTWNGENL